MRMPETLRWLTNHDMSRARARPPLTRAAAVLAVVPPVWHQASRLARSWRPAVSRPPRIAAAAPVMLGPAVVFFLMGAACMYLADPDSGAVRRARLREAMDTWWHKASARTKSVAATAYGASTGANYESSPHAAAWSSRNPGPA